MRASFYVVRKVFRRYPFVNTGDYIIKLPCNTFAVIKGYDTESGKFHKIERAVNGREFDRSYISNYEIDDEDLLDAIREFQTRLH